MKSGRMGGLGEERLEKGEEADKPWYPSVTVEEIGALAWYVLYTAPRAERGVMMDIKRELGAVTFMPTRVEKLRRGGRKLTATKTVFPRYVFLGVDGDPDRCWFSLQDDKSIVGVQRILYMDGKPFRVRPAVVVDLMTATKNGLFDVVPPADRPEIVPGAKVKILSGPFLSFCGEVAGLEDDGRASVLLTLFGRQSAALMDLDQLKLFNEQKRA